MWNRKSGCPIHCFSLVVCRHPDTKLWLAVEETKDRGWWLPGGYIDNGGHDIGHEETAIRETQEEAGVDVVLKGILRIENSIGIRGGRQRVIYYAEPKDPERALKPKRIPDMESVGAAWLSLEELREKSTQPPPHGLRGRELLDWATYIENGGTVYPLAVLANENTPVTVAKDRATVPGQGD